MARFAFSRAQERSFESAAQRATRLRGKGFLAVEIDGVVARFAGKGRKFPSASMRKRMGPMLTMGAIWLGTCRRRLLRGQTATPAKPFSATPGKKRAYVVSALYAGQSGAASQPSGAVRSPSSAAFHRKAGNPRPGVVTGALVNSLQVRTSGSRAIRFDAQGSSIGSSTYAVLKKTKKGSRLKAGRFVRNQWKLNGVWKHLRVNLIEPKEAEVQAIAHVLGEGGGQEIFSAFGVTERQMSKVGRGGKVTRFRMMEFSGSVDRALVGQLRRRWLRSNRG